MVEQLHNPRVGASEMMGGSRGFARLGRPAHDITALSRNLETRGASRLIYFRVMCLQTFLTPLLILPAANV